MHCDGARIWHAHVATDIPLDAYGRLFDTLSVCLCKGLGAPAGGFSEAAPARRRLGVGQRGIDCVTYLGCGVRRIEPALALEGPVAFNGRPWRHHACAGDLDDLPCPAPHVRVRQQRKWAGASVVVARSAVGEDNRRDIAREGHGPGSRRRLR